MQVGHFDSILDLIISPVNLLKTSISQNSDKKRTYLDREKENIKSFQLMSWFIGYKLDPNNKLLFGPPGSSSYLKSLRRQS